MNKYKHIFFDLDHTLWDFKTNSRLTLAEIYTHFNLESKGVDSVDLFVEIYEKYNHRMWGEYRSGKMSKDTLRVERFRQSLSHVGVKDKELSLNIGDFYVDHSPIKTTLFPGAIDVLTELSSRYEMHIITNGFEEIQDIKLSHSGLMPFFNKIITSERAGTKKPHPAIFNYSLREAEAKANESVMIGDNQLVDVEGAMKMGMDAVFFNPENEEKIVNPTYEIKELKQLLGFL
ncbi:MAG: YjjG family noncanonical pyrimidine nucleotidase [Salibacteraceae bacterium]